MLRGGGGAQAGVMLDTRLRLAQTFREGRRAVTTAGWCLELWVRKAFSYSPFLLDALRDDKEIKWPNTLYPDLHMPFAPSWSLHWAYRDGHLVNLPVSLLVEGDIIALRPGQESFASLRGIKVAFSCAPSRDMHVVAPATGHGGGVGRGTPGLDSEASGLHVGFMARLPGSFSTRNPVPNDATD